MKVLMTADCVGGVWTYALDLARHLTATGHSIVLAVMGDEPTAAQRDELDAAGLDAHAARPYKLEWMPGPEEDLAAAATWLLELAARHRPDVVHLNQFSHAALPWPCPTLVVAHSDVVTWWRAVHGSDPDEAWDAYRRRVAAGIVAADLVVAPTAATLDELRAAYAFDTKTRVVHNGRDFSVPARAKLPQVVAVGRVWDEAKNIAVAARASAGVAWPLLVAGPGEVDGAQCLGRLNPAEIAELLSRSRIFVAPARYEPFGLAALEAALAGCALVLGDIRSLREVWGDAATFVDPADETALREALEDLVAHPDVLAERSRAAAARAARFSAGAMAAAYADCYRDLCSPVGRPASVAS